MMSYNKLKRSQVCEGMDDENGGWGKYRHAKRKRQNQGTNECQRERDHLQTIQKYNI